MLDDPEGRTPLHYAALDNDLPRVQRLLDEGADPDAADAQDSAPFTSPLSSGR